MGVRPKGRETATRSHTTNALKMLGEQIANFGSGLGELLQQEVGVGFDRFGHAMLSCYTGDRKYNLHIDNCHIDEEGGWPDNGMRLTVVYYINMYWNPIKRDCGGGMECGG